MQKRTPAVLAEQIPTRSRASSYPEPFASRMAGRSKRALGDYFALQNFGVNLTTLAAGAMSALRHAHSRQDEFIYVVSGELVLISDAGETLLHAGMCAGFRAGSGDAHQLINRSATSASYLEIGDRTAGDQVVYPDDDLLVNTAVDGQRQFTHRDGRPY